MIIGRDTEQNVLDQALQSPNAELIAIYGRRRVGKTYLIQEHLRDHMVFELSGLHGESMNRQLEHFSYALRRNFPTVLTHSPSSWLEAFEQLKILIEDPSTQRPRRKKSKQVLFFDEFPWLATRRSGFLAAFEDFWNSFASRRNDLIVVICGSAASWMIKKVIGSRGGLHNRTTRRIRLEPFSLYETREYLRHRKVKLDDYQIAQLYMALGGVPHYLNLIQPGRSAAQNLDQLCFTKDGFLSDEFRNLYAALFDNHRIHEKIVRTLAAKGQGMDRNELLDASGLNSGGGLSTAIQELIESGFVHQSRPGSNKVKDTRYRLSDEYSLFYLNWIETSRTSGSDIWIRKSNHRRYASWCGYAFESLCLKHVPQIKTALGIANVETNESSWLYRPISKKEEGAQIDLVIERQDHCTNLCEIKFSQDTFTINKAYAANLERKLRLYRRHSKSRNTLFLTLLTTHGVKPNDYAKQLLASEVTLQQLMVH